MEPTINPPADAGDTYVVTSDALGNPVAELDDVIPLDNNPTHEPRSPTVVGDHLPDDPTFDKVYPLLAAPDLTGLQEAIDVLTHNAGKSYMTLGDDYDSSSVSDIPVVLHEVVQTMSRATGAVIYAIAMWDDGKEGTTMYETCSNRISEFVREGHSVRARQRLGNFTHHLLGPAFTRSRYRTWPTVYGLAQFDYRPRLPPEHPDLDQERHAVLLWFSKLAGWQGLPTIIDWEAVSLDITSATFVIVEKGRLPSLEIDWSDPPKWGAAPVRIVALHIRTHQDRLDAGDLSAQLTAFQWKEAPEHAVFRTTIHDSSELYYAEDATAYMSAMTRQNFRPYAYLPLSSAARPSMFTTEARALIAEAQHLDTAIAPLVPLLDAHERSDAPLGEASPQDPLIISEVPAVEHDIVSCLRNYRLPIQFSSYADGEHVLWSAKLLFSFVYNGGLHDAEGRLKRGWAGVLRVFIACIRGLRMHFTSHATNLAYIKDALEQELDNRKPLDQVELPPGTWNTPWTPAIVTHMTGFGLIQSETWRVLQPGVATPGVTGIQSAGSVTTGAASQPVQPVAHPLPTVAIAQEEGGGETVLDLSTPPGPTPPARSLKQELIRENIPNPFQPSDLYENDSTLGSKERGTRTDVKHPIPLPAPSDTARSRRSLSAPLGSEHRENALGLSLPAPPSREDSPDLLSQLALNNLTTPSFRAPAASSTPAVSSTPFGRGRTLVKSPPPSNVEAALTTTQTAPTLALRPPASTSAQAPLVHTGAPALPAADQRSDLGNTVAGRAALRNMRAASSTMPTQVRAASAFPESSSRPAGLTIPRRGAPKRAISKRALSDEEAESSAKKRSASGSGSRSKR